MTEPGLRGNWDTRSLRGLGVATVFVVWSFVWDNARMPPAVAADGTRLVLLPRTGRLLEVGAVAVVLVLALLGRRRGAGWWTLGAAATLLTVGLSCFSAGFATYRGYVGFEGASETIYAYLGPLGLAAGIGGLARREGDGAGLVRVFLGLVVVNCAVAWHQWIVQGEWGDFVHGAMHDAHVLANVAWLAVLWFLVRLSTGYGRTWTALLGIAWAAPVAWAAQNEKGNLDFLGVAALLLASVLWRRGFTGRMAVSIAAAALVLAGVAAGSGRLTLPGQLGRVSLVIDHLPQLGIVRGYQRMPEVYRAVPYAALIGSGPGSYGSAQAVDQVVSGGEAPVLAARYTAESYRLNYFSALGSFTEESTDANAFPVEFGLLALVGAGLGVWWLVGKPAWRARRSQVIPEAAVGQWVLWSLTYLFVESAVTAFYGWSAVYTSTIPIVAAGSLLYTGGDSVPGPVTTT